VDASKAIGEMVGPMVSGRGTAISPDLAWVEPTIEHVARLIRDFFKNPGGAQRSSDEAGADLR